MKMNLFSKTGFAALACAVAMVGKSGAAVDLAEAAEVLTEIDAIAASIKADIALAAAAGDAEASEAAMKRSDAIDTAVAMAREAYASMEAGVNSGNLDAAESAQGDLAAALVQVRDALMGAVPEAMAATAGGETDGQQSGGSPGDPDDPPNIHEVPWKSQGIKAYYQSLFGTWYNARSFGHGRGLGDGDATPE